MTPNSPQPSTNDPAEAWLAAALTQAEPPPSPDWRLKAVGGTYADVMATAPPHLPTQVLIPRTLAHRMAVLGEEQDISRQGILHKWIAEGFARDTGADFGEVFALFPQPRRKNRRT